MRSFGSTLFHLFGQFLGALIAVGYDYMDSVKQRREVSERERLKAFLTWHDDYDAHRARGKLKR